MSATETITQRGRPFLLIGRSVAEAPGLEQALGELGVAGSDVPSLSVSEAVSGLQHLPGKKPRVILLTLQGPGGTELAVLKSLKEDPRLRSLPVVVLGPSGDACLVGESFGLGAAGYMAHPADPRELAAVLRTVSQYWSLSKLPK